MSDPSVWFRDVERIAPPDLWPDIEGRRPSPERPGSPRRRVLAAAVALVVAAAGIGLAVHSFRPGPARRPVSGGALPRLTSVNMVDPLTGWAASGRNVFRTTDGGNTWVDVTPPAAGIRPRSPDIVSFFLNVDDAWLAVPATGASKPAKVIVFRTTDGGKTWTGSRSFVRGAGLGWLDFADPLHGWFMSDLGGAAGSQAVAIYRTTDGGASWSLVARTPTRSVRPRTLPFGCDKTGIAFVDASTGWVTGSCAGGGAFFYATHDGGSTWTPQALPGTPPQGESLSYPPAFTSTSEGVLGTDVYVSSSVRSVLLVTHDGGATWGPVTFPTGALGGRPDFIDATHGWVVGRIPRPNGGSTYAGLYATDDGGATWSRISTDRRIQGTLDFVTTSVGFSLSGPGRLFRTTDGGRTWAELSPVVRR